MDLGTLCHLNPIAQENEVQAKEEFKELLEKDKQCKEIVQYINYEQKSWNPDSCEVDVTIN